MSGNSGTGPEFLGTINNQPLQLRANNARALVLASASRTTTSGTSQRTYNTMNLVAGSSANTVSNEVIGATIAGGGASGTSSSGPQSTTFRKPNVVISDFGTIGGGLDNRVGTVGLPDLGVAGTVAGGSNNWVGGRYGAIAGGQDNRISEHDAGTIGGGFQNSVSKSGMFFGSSFGGTVPGGAYNEASANYTFAAGFRAKARHDGSFVWSDGSSSDFISTANNQFSVRSTGGARFVTALDGSGNPTAGVRLEPGWTSWGAISDRNAKKNVQPVSGKEVLQKLAQVPVLSWNYRWEDTNTTPHLGPMAQDFKAAFFPGRDDKIITTLEFDGVELAAIKALQELIEEKDSRVAALEHEVTRLSNQFAAQQQTMARWESRFATLEQIASTASADKTTPASTSSYEAGTR